MDLQKILNESGLRMDFIAAKLYPDNAHPYNALNRLILRGGSLKAEQLKTLAETLGVTSDSLLGLNWSGSVGQKCIILRTESHFVTIMPSLGLCEIRSKKNAEEVEHSVPIDMELPVRQFLAKLNEELNKLS